MTGDNIVILRLDDEWLNALIRGMEPWDDEICQVISVVPVTRQEATA